MYNFDKNFNWWEWWLSLQFYRLLNLPAKFQQHPKDFANILECYKRWGASSARLVFYRFSDLRERCSHTHDYTNSWCCNLVHTYYLNHYLEIHIGMASGCYCPQHQQIFICSNLFMCMLCTIWAGLLRIQTPILCHQGSKLRFMVMVYGDPIAVLVP